MSKLLRNVALILCFFSISNAFVFAAPDDAEDLTQVKKAIESVQKDLQRKNQTKKDVAQTISQTQSALEKSRQELSKLNSEHKAIWGSLQKLQQQLTQLSVDIGNKKAQIARLLNIENKKPQQDALILLLKNNDPNQKGRDLTYFRYMTQANQKVIGELRNQQLELAQNEQEIKQQLQALDKVVKAKQVLVSQAKDKNSQALVEHNKINQDIARQNKKLAELKSDERHLSQLLRGLARKSSLKNKTKSQAILEERKTSTPPQGQSNTVVEGEDKTQPAPSVKEESQVEAVATNKNNHLFSQAQGRLPMPVNGHLMGKFGSAQPDGGTYKGIFIAAASGQSVKSVFAGNVIYAAPLKGYGNTVIVDHGENYLSIYTGLSSMSVSAGRSVKMNQSIGTTGQNNAGQTGLYFEIRYISQPINPLPWLS
ncbi:murein hydrolase activator EnvC family protein [Neisseria sp. Ec49-e6-T10]|uniref:murein hydrolase activator EnvC family protein n=1 Tax=Neisseria sp. Ec49-e6-T10 TaxID=3140744 RepID=UPI003EB76C18